jgi:hypothetical protein
MLPSSKPLEYAWPLEMAELAPKDTAEDRYVKPPPVPHRLPFAWLGYANCAALPSLSPDFPLPSRPKSV